MAREKLCVFCRNCEMEVEGYDTSGYWPVMNCGKGYWHGSYARIPDRETLLMAETCPDYDEAKP